MPIGLMVVMVGMGMSLRLQSFKELFLTPKAALTGIIGQLLLLPLCALAIIALIPLPDEVALGLVLLSACPGGVTSNALTYIAKADVALSVGLTAFNSFAVVISLPLILQMGMGLLSPAAGEFVSVPFGLIVKQLIILSLIPILVGMTTRHFAPGFAERARRYVQAFTILLLTGIFFSLLISQYEFFLDHFMMAGPVSLLLMGMTLSIGYGAAKLFKLPEKTSLTILIEICVQNTIVAVFIASVILENERLAIVPSLYGVLMMLVIGILLLSRKWLLR